MKEIYEYLIKSEYEIIKEEKKIKINNKIRRENNKK